MAEQLKYVITQDTRGLFSMVDRSLDVSRNDLFGRSSQNYFSSLGKTLSQILSPHIMVVQYFEEEMESELREKVVPKLLQDDSAVCICLDRFLLNSIEADDTFKDRFFRFSMCRTVDGVRTPRQGGVSFKEQIEELKKRLPDIDNRKVILVDDGLFSGGTVREFVDLASQNGTKLVIDKIIGFIGNDSSSATQAMPAVEVIKPVSDLYDWIDIRDFTPLGGKKFAASRTNQVASTVPYLFPWSDGASASLDLSPGFFTASIEMIEAFKRLVESYEQSTNSLITFRQLLKSGFPLPTNILKSIPVSINERLTHYLDRCASLVNEERSRQVVVFDMDGTLYELDGANKGFKGSRLESKVLQNARNFIKDKERCDDAEVQMILDQALQDPIGISKYLARRYHISRLDYFNIVWNINPTGIVQNYEVPAQMIRQLKNVDQQKKLILLTSAPRVWAQQVLDFIGIKDSFEVLYTGEQFGNKDEIFTMLAGRYIPSNILSVGDQIETDIKPAEKLGINTFQVSSPTDLKQWKE